MFFRRPHIIIDIDLSGRDDTDLHEILAKLQTQEHTMSELSDAVDELTATISAMVTRIDEDVAHLQELIEAANSNDASDAVIAELQADAAATVSRISEATATLAAIDPVSTFPVEEETPGEEDPVEEDPEV